MNLAELLRYSPIANSICSNLTFTEANWLRKILKISSLDCQIAIIDPDQQLHFLDKIDDEAVIIHNYIRKYGSNYALIKAAKNNRIKVVKFLLWNGIYSDIKDSKRFTALMKAAQRGYLSIVKKLVYYAANVNLINKLGFTALIYASAHGHYSVIKFLLDHGADPRIVTPGGFTAFEALSLPTPDTVLNASQVKIIELLRSRTYS